MSRFGFDRNLLSIAFDHLKLEKGKNYLFGNDEAYTSHFKEFKFFIRDILRHALQNKTNWRPYEFLDIYMLFEIEIEVNKLHSKVHNDFLIRKNLLYIDHESKPISLMCIENIESNIHKKLIFSQVSENKNSRILTPLQWLKLIESTIPSQAGSYGAEISVSKESLLIHPELKACILYKHYNLDERKVKEGIFPMEIYSLQEASKHLDLSTDNFLVRCFMDKIGIYCKTSNYIVSNYHTYPINYEALELTYVYPYLGLVRLHTTDDSFGDSPVKRLCYSDAIQVKNGYPYLIVPIRPSLAEICQGVTAKHICLQSGQQISRNDIYFIKSDIDTLKDEYHSGTHQGFELSASLLKNLELGVKTRENNKKFAKIASKTKKLKAKERWDEPLNCALSIARENPSRYFATDLARLVAKKKFLPGEIETLRKKIAQTKSIKKYLRQMQETEQ
jgi:hypothetical protein